ncbi:hypothetical protein ABE10_03140, partial [Bacillus toyonensis]|nr:hypothetical protein [Bacillus toyonensis]
MGDRGEALDRLGRTQVVVQFGDERHDPARVPRPGRQLLRARAMQGRRQEDHTFDVVSDPVLQRQLGAEGPADEPRPWKIPLTDE